MNTTKLLTITIFMVISSYGSVSAQCSLIKSNGSSQDPRTVCAPVEFKMNVWYKFMIPLTASDTANIRVEFVWNDAAGNTSIVPGIWNSNLDSVWAEEVHVYPPDDECSKTAMAYLRFDGTRCTSSSYQEQTFSTWGTDEENSGELYINPAVAYVCEGDPVDVTFADNSTFNCNINIEADNPNEYYRWVQFIYGTYAQSGDRIPDISVTDAYGTVHQLTDAAGASLGELAGPIVRMPIPANGPDQISYNITAPPNGVAGDIFEITMRNWNVCNPYDLLPKDGIPPSDTVLGDSMPLEITARIEIIAPPPVTTTTELEYCTGETINLTANADTSTVRWYQDSLLTILLKEGTSYDPTWWPYSLDINTPGEHTFWVTSNNGLCESSPTKVHLVIHQTPLSVFAGDNKAVCSHTITLFADNPPIGTGKWTTGSGALINNDTLFNSFVSNLQPGDNQFIWEVTNGPCTLSDNVTITREIPPTAANAGIDSSYCHYDSLILYANTPDNNGSGQWSVLTGSGTISDINNPTASFKNPVHGNNTLVWSISSQYASCPASYDTIELFSDLYPGQAFAGFDRRECEISSAGIVANEPINNGIGYWTELSGSIYVSDTSDYATLVNNLQYGENLLSWTVNSLYGICPTNVDSVIIYRDENPGTADAGNDVEFCLVNSYQLQGNTPMAGNGTWNVIQNPSATAPNFSADNTVPDALFSVDAGNEGLYVLEWSLQNYSCKSSDTVIIDLGIPPPAADAGKDSSVCDTSIVLHANTFPQGTTYWQQIYGSYAAQFSSDLSNADNRVGVNEGEEGSYQFEWTIKSGSCPTTSDTVTIIFNAAPTRPITGDVENCGPGSFPLEAITTSNDDLIFWLTNDIDTNAIDTGDIFITPYLTSDSVFYIRSVDTISMCVSEPTAVYATIHEIPSKPTLISDTLCSGGNGSLVGYITPPADLLRWYDQKTDSIAASTNSNYITDSLNSSKWFYADAYNSVTGCTSNRDSAQVFVWPEIPVPVAISDSSCYPKSFQLRAYKNTGSNLLIWHDSASGGSTIGVGDTLTTVTLSSDRSYWVSEFSTVSFCESKRVEVKAIINERPSLPIVQDTSNCGPSDFTFIPETDSLTDDIYWYHTIIDEDPFAVTDTLHTSTLTTNKTYWLKAKNNTTGCESDLTSLQVSIFALPTPINISGPTVVLKDQTGIVFATDGASTSSYDWIIPAGITLDANENDFVRLSFPNTGSFTISVTETTQNGCPGTEVSHPIEVIDDSVVVDIGTDNLASCTNAPFEIQPYLFGGMPPFIYEWTGDTAYLSATNELYASFYSPETGTFNLYLRVEDIYDKVAYDTVTITVYDAPEASITTLDSIVCVGDELMLNTTSSGSSPFKHRWSGPIAYLDDFNIQNPTFSPVSADTFQFFYQLTDANGCSATDSINLQSDIPNADFDIDTVPGCSPLPVGFINKSTDAVSYSWDFDDGTSSTKTNPQKVFTNSSAEVGYYHVTLTAASRLGCIDTKSTYVSVWPNPTAELSAVPAEACSPASIVLYSTPGNSVYSYDFGNEQTYTGNKLTHIQQYVNKSNADISFIASVATQSAFGCYDTATTEILIHATPEALFDLSPPFDTVPDNTFSVTNNTTGDYNYVWDFGNGFTSYDKDPEDIIYDGAGNYSIQLKASNSYCADSINKTAYLYPATPVANFKCSGPGCMPHTITLVNNSEYADNYYWEFGDGSVSTAPNPTYTYYQSGKYRISLTVTGEGGESYYSDTLSVYKLPNSFFDIAPRKVYVNDEAVYYFNLSEHGDIYEWDFGDGTISSDLNPTHVYKEEGTFDVTLKVWTSESCFDLYVMENAVIVEPSGNIRFPNVIRPNSPFTENTTFLPGVIDNVDKYHLMIYNRWGELIFESKSVDEGWDGTYNRTLAKQDVYIWKVTGTYTDGKAFEKTGDVTLLY